MSYFELFFWSFLGVVATDIFLKAYPLKGYPKEKLFNSIIVRGAIVLTWYLIATFTAIASFVLIVEGDKRPSLAILLGASVGPLIPRMRGVKKLANTIMSIMSHLVNSYSHSRLMQQA